MAFKFENLKIWQLALQLSGKVSVMVKQYPKDELFILTSQIKRAVVSIASNIAEGAGRNTNGEFIQFLGIANGSSFELTTQLIITAELGLVKQDQVSTILKELDEIQKMIYAFMNNLSNKKYS